MVRGGLPSRERHACDLLRRLLRREARCVDDLRARLGTDAADLARFLSRADARTMNRERLQADLDMGQEQYVAAWRELHRFGYVSSAELRRLVVER
jgi:hypothetical protein